jgi:phosphoribosyl 1,2-cyclic phosphate phosphodiesterase
VKITFLGTGTSQGIPIIMCKCPVCLSTDTRDKRLRTSLLVEIDDKTIIIDAGPDFRQQMLTNNVESVDAIFITHEHKDHTAGLDDVRPYNFLQNKAMDIYAEKRVCEAIKREYAYVFEKVKYPGIPQFNMIEIEENDFFLYGHRVTPIRVMHMDLPILGFRINQLSYITDASSISDDEIEKIKGSEVLIINTLRKEKHYSHFSLSETLNIIEIIKPKQAFLTHVGHQIGLYEKISQELPKNVVLAYDTLSFDLT